MKNFNEIKFGELNAAGIWPKKSFMMELNFSNNSSKYSRKMYHYVTYKYQGNIGLNPKQFYKLVKANKLRYSGALKHAFLDYEERYITKYSFVLPTYFLYNIHLGINLKEGERIKNIRNKLKNPFIYNITFYLNTNEQKIDSEINELTDIPKHIIILSRKSYEFKLIEKFSLIQEQNDNKYI